MFHDMIITRLTIRRDFHRVIGDGKNGLDSYIRRTENPESVTFYINEFIPAFVRFNKDPPRYRLARNVLCRIKDGEVDYMFVDRGSTGSRPPGIVPVDYDTMNTLQLFDRIYTLEEVRRVVTAIDNDRDILRDSPSIPVLEGQMVIVSSNSLNKWLDIFEENTDCNKRSSLPTDEHGFLANQGLLVGHQE
jgi:hypothetical protein